MTQPILPGAGVTTSGGRKGSARKFIRNRRDRRRACRKECQKLMQNFALMHGVDLDAELSNAHHDELFRQLRTIWKKWTPDVPFPNVIGFD